MQQHHQYTIEHIYHFTCGKCSQWWSYAYTELFLPRHAIKKFTCPHCGYADKVKYKV